MTNELFKKVYDPEYFKQTGKQLIEKLGAHIAQVYDANPATVIPYKEPNEALHFWREYLAQGNSEHFFEEVLARSTHLHHPKYIAHQVGPAAPITVLTSMISAILNNGTAVYEMGMVTNPMERIITELLADKIGYDDRSSGFLTSGGTLANLTAMLSARKAKVSEDIWNEGHSKPLGIMVSEEAHYCIERAAKIMGLGEMGIIKIPVNSDYSMETNLLEKIYQETVQKGIEVFAIVGSAPSTATGIFDHLDVVGDFALKHNLWFHVDAAHGGATLFSKKYKHLLKGIAKSDSVVIDGHKMMMMPGITTALVYKDSRNSNATFSQKADYLLEDSVEADWYNSGKRTFECTKNMMALHWFSLLKTYGESIFDVYVTSLFDLGFAFGAMIANDAQFELATLPKSNIICFRYIDGKSDENMLNQTNLKIRRALLEDGEFYIVQTKLRGIHYLRCTIMNPFTTETHLKALLEKIKEIVKALD